MKEKCEFCGTMVHAPCGDLMMANTCANHSNAVMKRDLLSPDPRVVKWDKRFLEMTKMVSTWSKDPSTKCGAVIVRPDLSVCSVGFNGFPRGCDDSPELYAQRDLKYERVIHAEMNAIVAAKEPLVGYTMYTYPYPPCCRCTAHIIQSGIRRVVHWGIEDSEFSERWGDSNRRGLQMYREAGVEIVAHHE